MIFHRHPPLDLTAFHSIVECYINIPEIFIIREGQTYLGIDAFVGKVNAAKDI